MFHALEWIEKNAVASSVHFDERQQFHWEIKVDQLVNHSNVRRMILMIKFSHLNHQNTLSRVHLSIFIISCWMFLLKIGSLEYKRSP